jgi:hypothetical protein
LSFQDLSAFRPQAGNWQIVGDVTIIPTIDIHPEEKKETPDADATGSKGGGFENRVVDQLSQACPGLAGIE